MVCWWALRELAGSALVSCLAGAHLALSESMDVDAVACSLLACS